MKFVQAGSGFLSQHTKEVFFGLGKSLGPVRATVRWPSGLVQQFDNVLVGHRVEIEEGDAQFRAHPFASRDRPSKMTPVQQNTLPAAITDRRYSALVAPPGFTGAHSQFLRNSIARSAL